MEETNTLVQRASTDTAESREAGCALLVPLSALEEVLDIWHTVRDQQAGTQALVDFSRGQQNIPFATTAQKDFYEQHIRWLQEAQQQRVSQGTQRIRQRLLGAPVRIRVMDKWEEGTIGEVTLPMHWQTKIVPFHLILTGKPVAATGVSGRQARIDSRCYYT